MDILREALTELRSTSSGNFLGMAFVYNNGTRSARTGHLQTTAKSIQNVLTKGHNWLQTLNLIPENLTQTTGEQAASRKFRMAVL